jgi:S1-C subfamily serine protease
MKKMYYSHWFIIVFILFVLFYSSEAKLFEENNLEKAISYAKIGVIPIMHPDGDKILGTGFLTKTPSNTVWIITNAHVVKRYFEIVGSSLAFTENFVGQAVKGRFDIYLGTKIVNLYIAKYDKNIDVAILYTLKEKPNEIWPFVNQPGNYDIFCSSNDIVEGKEIVFIGYPLGLGKEYTNRPISKMGMIAQNSNEENDFFLIDAICNPGYSGAPVFGIKEGRLIYFGTIRGYQKDFISSFDESGSLILQLPYNSGLGNVIKANKIKNLIDESYNLLNK